ncbi:hypothetical protein BDV19DRAFT_371401 [Aspergillus venezuelensis]
MADKELRDNVSRVKASSPLGKSVFVGLRAADVVWQYNLISRGWAGQFIEKLGGRGLRHPVGLGPGALAQINPYLGLVNAFALGSAVKQIIHIIFVSEQEMPTGSAIAIPLFNTIFNTLNTLFAIWTVTSPITSSNTQLTTFETIATNPLIAIGATAYFIGIIAEAVSEFQRKAFKADPANKGQPYAGGLFSLARNINYGAYTVWRAGYALACGGLSLGAVTFSFFFYDFAARGVPVLEKYMVERYGEKYLAIKERVKYTLIPGIY